MLARSLLLLVILLAIIHIKDTNAQNFACGNKQFLKNHKDTFRYDGVIENGIRGTTNNVTKIKLSATVQIENWQTCDFILKFSKTTFQESFGVKDAYTTISSTDFVRRLEAHPLMFTMNAGIISSITPSVKSTQSDVLNVQRGVLSIIQLSNTENAAEIVEDDVSGSCLTRYSTRDLNKKFYHVSKVKELSSCKEHHLIRANIDGHSYNDDENDNNNQDSVYKSSSECLYKLDNTKWGLKKVVCEERFLARAFSTEQNAGAYVFIRSELIKTSTAKITRRNIPYKDLYETTIKYDHEEPEDERAKSKTYRENVKAILLKLSEKHYFESKPNSAQLFFDLVISFRHLKKSDLEAIIKSLDLSKEAISSFLFDAMAQCATTNCLSVLFKIMQTQGKQAEALRFMPYIAFMKEPTPDVIRMLMGFHKKTNDPSLLLLISTLSYKMCRNHYSECEKQVGMVGQVVKDTENYLLAMLGRQCSTEDLVKQHKIFYALKGIGNLGRPTQAIPVILDCIQSAKHINTSATAIQSLRKMTLKEEHVNTLLEMFLNRNNDLEKRVEIFLILMKNPSKETISFAIDIANDEEEVVQLRSLIHSFLRSSIKSKAPSTRKLSKLFTEVMKENPLVDYEPPASQYSKAFLNSFKIFGFGGTVNGHTFFHPDSFVPRTMNFNLTTHLFGFSVNALEVKARMEGVERLLWKYMGNEGYFSSSYLKKILKVPPRVRRSAGGNQFAEIDDKISVKESSPQALISLKVFGNELKVFTLEDIPLLNGDMDEINVVKYMYNLMKGQRKTIKNNMVVMEVSHKVPTLLGVPMKIAINGSAVVTIDTEVKVNMKNMIVGPKNVIVKGSLKPSVSVHASGKLSVVCPGVTEIGTSFMGNVHFGKQLDGKIEFTENKGILDLKTELNADKETTDLLNVSYNIFHETGMKKEKVNGIEKRVKGVFCSDEIFDSIVIGTKLCVSAEFPNAYYNYSTPYFPLTGPFSFGVRNYPVDPLLTKYLLHFKAHGKSYTVTVSTPGATSERKYIFNAGVGQDGSSVALTYGGENRGIEFKYRIEKVTNEILATLRSNITESPIVFSWEFFNTTDTTTLNRHVGIRGTLIYKKIFIEHSLFYKNTYEYWALGSKVEYSKGKAVSLDLKIQYKPQMFKLVMEHLPTNTRLITTAYPSLPKLEGRIDIKHGNNVDIKTYGQLDISQYKLVGDVKIQPGNHTVTATGKLVPALKNAFLNANLNGIPLTWKAKLDSNRKKKKTVYKISNELKIGDKKIDLTVLCNIHSANYTLMMNNKQIFYGTNVMSRMPGNLKLSSTMNGVDMEEFKLDYELSRDKEMHKQCTTGSYGKEKYGKCYTIHHKENKYGIVFSVQEKEKWLTPVSILLTKQKGKRKITTKIYDHFTAMYERSDKELTLLVKTPKLEWNVDTIGTVSEPKLDYNVSSLLMFMNGATRNEMSVKLKRSLIGGDTTAITITHRVNKTNMNTIKLSSMVEGKKFIQTLRLFGKKNAHIYTVVMKDPESQKPKELGEENYLVFIRNGWSFKSFEINIKNKMTLRLSEIINDVNADYLLEARQFDAWSEQQTPLTKTGSLKFLKDGKAQIVLYETPMMAQYIVIGKTIVNQLIGKYVNTIFRDKMKMDEKFVTKLSGIFQQLLISYFSTTKCNGGQVHQKHIKGVISKEDIVDIIMKLLKFPISKEFEQLIKLKPKENLFGKEFLEILRKEEGKTMYQIIDEILSAIKIDDKILKELSQKAASLKDVLAKDQTFNVFEREFIDLLQKIAGEIQTAITSKKFNPKSFNIITKYLPRQARGKVEKILKDIVELAMKWKFDLKKDPMVNAKDLMKKLEKAKIFDLLKLDHTTIILRGIIERSKLPKALENILNAFLSNLNHVNLVQKLSKFVLQTYKVPAPHKRHIDKGLNSKNLNDYFNVMATTIVNNGRISPKEKEPFRKFLETRNLKTLFNGIKQTYKNVDFTLLDVLLLDGNMKSYEDLPDIFTVNFIPKFLTKLLQNMKKFNLPSTLETLSSYIIKDKDLGNAINEMLRQKKIEDLPASIVKLAIKTSGDKELTIEEKRVLKEAETFTLKFIAMVIDKQNNFEDQLKRLSLRYFDAVSKLLKTEIPKPFLTRTSPLLKDIRRELQQIKVQDLKKDATETIKKTSGVIVGKISAFMSKNLNNMVAEDLMASLKSFMTKVNINEKNLWELKEKYAKETNKQLSFLIRLLGQFSTSKKNSFAKQYTTKDGKILYYKIYQSIFKSKVASVKNLEQVDALFKGLEENAMKQMMLLTGDASLPVVSAKFLLFGKDLMEGQLWPDAFWNITKSNTSILNSMSKFLTSEFKGKHTIPTALNKILFFFKGFAKGQSDLVKLVKEYQKNRPTLTKASYDIFKKQVKELLIIVGHAKENGQTINARVGAYIPKFLQSIATQLKQNTKDNSKYERMILNLKGQIRQAFSKAKSTFKETQEREHNIIIFLFDILLPAVNSLYNQETATIQTPLNIDPNLDRCSVYLIATYRKPYGMDEEAFKNDKNLQRYIKEQRESTYCAILNFLDNVSKLKRDKAFVNTLIDESMDVAMKFLDETVQQSKKQLTDLKKAVDATRQLSNNKKKNVFQETVFFVGNQIVKAWKNMPLYTYTERLLDRSLDIEHILSQQFSKDKISWKIPTTEFEKMTKLYISEAIKNASKLLKDVSKEILIGIDEIKTPMSESEFVTDPVGFMKGLPNKLYQDVIRNMKKNMDFKTLKKLEREIRALHQKFKVDLRKYSGKLNAVAKKLLDEYKEEINKILKPALAFLHKHNKELNEKLKGYMITSQGSVRLRNKLTILSKKMLQMRKQFKGIQTKFVDDLKKNISGVLSKKDAMKELNSGKILQTAMGGIDTKALGTALRSLNQDLKGIIANAIYPQLTVMAKSIDQTVCQIKKNISKFYIPGKDKTVIFWEMPKAYQIILRFKRKGQMYSKIMEKRSKEMMSSLINHGLTMQNTQEKIKNLEVNVSQFIQTYGNNLKENIDKQFKTHAEFQKMVKKPDILLSDALKKYQDLIKKVAVKVNNAMKVTPPDAIEKPIIKFLGLRPEVEHTMFKPISRTAYLFEKTLVTFDGKPIYLPKQMLTSNCLYLLSRDFLWKNFTVYLTAGKLFVELTDGKVVIDRNKQNKVNVYMGIPPKFTSTKKVTSLPVQMAFTSIVKLQPNVLKIHSLYGLTVYCQLDVFSCNFTVSGYYHNKAAGLFGTNNVESSDDLKLPSGRISFELSEFLNEYELTKKSKCFINDLSELISNKEITENEEICKKLIAPNKESIKLVNFKQRTKAFEEVCKNEKSQENVQKAYTSSIKEEFGQVVRLFKKTSGCQETILRFSDNKNSKTVHLTIILKLSPRLQKVKQHLKRILRKIEKDMGKKYTLMYTLAGYGGQRVHFEPHVQTGRSGKVFMRLSEALEALQLMAFNGKPVKWRQGLLALKFASQLEFGKVSKIFLLFDDDASYTNALRDMVEVNNALNKKGIILNVVNTYNMRKDVIGKDSNGKRYHVRVPVGEDFSKVSLPPPDDYIPLVKQSRGAVFTLKAFLKTKEEWAKALPISITSAFKLQAKIDQNQCKECACSQCKNVPRGNCDIDV